MMSVDSNFNFPCGRPHGANPLPRTPEPDPLPPPCGRHKPKTPYDLAFMCHWLVLTSLWLGFGAPLVDVDLIIPWFWSTLVDTLCIRNRSYKLRVQQRLLIKIGEHRLNIIFLTVSSMN